MNNLPKPWLTVPLVPPYWLPSDYDKIRNYNATQLNQDLRVQEKVLPEPFIGNVKAPVVLLNLNPGFGDRDSDDHERADFQTLLRNNYSQSPSDYPFYFLNPIFDNGGRRWWEKKLAHLLVEFDRKHLARSILCVEYFPYHSRRFGHGSLELPSQEFGFDLVRSAINRGAVVVVMRGRKRWLKRIPELKTYHQGFTLNSPQNVMVSPGNCPKKGFERVISTIRAFTPRIPHR